MLKAARTQLALARRRKSTRCTMSEPSSKTANDRAGRYVRQPTGYRAFIPKPLPPDPALVISPEVQVLLSKADRALGRLDGSIQTLPHPDLFVFMYVRKEAVLSSQIEGTQSSLQDVLAAEAQILSPDRPQDVDEVVNYVRAMNYGLERLKELPVSVRLIREIHAELLKPSTRNVRRPRHFHFGSACDSARRATSWLRAWRAISFSFALALQ